MKDRIVITGMGAITPIGLGVEEYWRNLLAGQCGIGPITLFDSSRLPVHIAAEIKNFNAQERLPKSIARLPARFIQFAYTAANEALEQSGLNIADCSESTGICMGTALAGVRGLTAGGAEYVERASGKISPHLVPRSLGNMAAAHLSIELGIHGPSFTINTACSAGGDAAMCAAMFILSGYADAMIVVGGESIICPTIISSLAQAKALSRRNDSPQTASRPFDLHRDGFVIGEGGGALVLEREQTALARGANILAVLSGWANTLDGHHITAPDPEGKGAARCMQLALDRANMQPADIGYINAHGTSTLLGDRAETLAMKQIFGSADTAPPVSSTKGATGHLMGAGGLTELIACIMAIRENILPPTINLTEPDPVCDLDYVPNSARPAQIEAAMSNSLGFGGQNSSVIVSRYHAKET